MYKILIVEDEYWMFRGLEKVIGRNCPEFAIVSFAMNGEEALEIMRQQEVDVVITDISMPVMDGLELIKEMRSRKNTKPVIIITGYSEFEYARAAIQYGVKNYLLKPLDPAEVRDALERLKQEWQSAESPDQAPLELNDLPSGKELIRQVLKHIDTAFHKADLSLSSIANETGYNASYLTRLFKDETGRSFVKYVNDVRIREARQLLRETGLTVAEIAIKVGFWDVKYFSRFFRREVGLSPSEYRQLDS